VEKLILDRGGVYLAKLDPAKVSEVGKIRPIVILNTEFILQLNPPTVFICPLSSQSFSGLKHLHVRLSARDNLLVESYALVEHCRSITVKRLIFPKIAQLQPSELATIIHRLQLIIGF
jgi:mRNA interferase MazF